MQIYRCKFELMEHLFFASREINDYFQTEAVIGNYALAYALGFCQSEYHNNGEIHYTRDLGRLNQDRLYVTPGTITGRPSFVISRFNAISDSYWFRMEQNAVSVDRRRIHNERLKARPANFPQTGRIKMLSIGNCGLFYVASQEPITIPRYIRLGKFMSKVKISARKQTYKVIETESHNYAYFLNPNDLDEQTKIGFYDLLNVKPTPLISNAVLTGKFYQLSDETLLPAGMEFHTIG